MSAELVPVDVEGDKVGWSRRLPAGQNQWTVFYAALVRLLRLRFRETSAETTRREQIDGVTKLYDILASQDPLYSPDPFPRRQAQTLHDAR